MFLPKGCLFRLLIILLNTLLYLLFKKVILLFFKKRFNQEGRGIKKVFIIVLARLFQLYAYIPLRNMKDQSTVVRLKKCLCACYFLVFKKFSMHRGWKNI